MSTREIDYLGDLLKEAQTAYNALRETKDNKERQDQLRRLVSDGNAIFSSATWLLDNREG